MHYQTVMLRGSGWGTGLGEGGRKEAGRKGMSPADKLTSLSIAGVHLPSFVTKAVPVSFLMVFSSLPWL